MVARAAAQNRLGVDDEGGGRIEPDYTDAFGRKHTPRPRTIKAIRAAMEGEVPDPFEVIAVTEDESGLAPGYHDMRRRDGRRVRLLVTPAACYLPDAFRIWGWAIQLYAARSRASWGIGDLADLRTLGRWAAADGARMTLVNPLAAATPILPQQPSPYFPSSRRFRSPLYLRVEEVEGAETLRDLPEIAARGRALNGNRLIDRDEVFRLKNGALERIWNVVRGRRSEGFARFRSEQGSGLREFALFSALAERFQSGWHRWPAAFRHPGLAAVQSAARDRKLLDRVCFHEWLQYQVDRQLQKAARALPVMQDLPIGFDADGADAWAFQDVIADRMTVGAPPDEFNTKGQNWGLPPFAPDRLRAAGYEPFIQTIRACVRHAGGLRIDHVMGLFRLFWIPAGMEPTDGAYVRGHADEVLAIVAIESQRARAVIVGEDLGTVDEDARAALVANNILSYRLVWFEKGPPARFPREALAAVTTHDLPTVAGLWTGSDLRAQKDIGLAPNEKGTREIRRRTARLCRATSRTPVERVIARVHEALGKAPSRIVTATVDDAMGVEERPNMPATSDEWPNWRLALPQPIESLRKNPLAGRIARALGRSRSR